MTLDDKRRVKAPKLFWCDTGLAAHLCEISSVEALRADSIMLGRMVETLVMMEIQALLPLSKNVRAVPASALFMQ